MKTRTLIIPFSPPSIGPSNAEEDAAHEEFENNLFNNYYSSAIGWIVGLRKVLLNEGREKIQNAKLQLQNACVMKARNITGCSIEIFVLEQVSHRIQLHVHACEVSSYLCDYVSKFYAKLILLCARVQISYIP